MADHPSGYVKGCPCERCEKIRARNRAYQRSLSPEAKARMRRYKTAKQKEYDDRPGRRDAANERARLRYQQWRSENPLPPRSPSARPANSKRHGGPDEWARMYAAQGGLCYLCLQPLPENRSQVHVDHDHSCCDPGPRGRNTDSCAACRRGLTHERCNQIWGLAKENGPLLRTMAEQGEQAKAEAQVRIAAKQSASHQLSLLA